MTAPFDPEAPQRRIGAWDSEAAVKEAVDMLAYHGANAVLRTLAARAYAAGERQHLEHHRCERCYAAGVDAERVRIAQMIHDDDSEYSSETLERVYAALRATGPPHA